jgi:hypothetical protein
MNTLTQAERLREAIAAQNPCRYHFERYWDFSTVAPGSTADSRLTIHDGSIGDLL